VRKTKKKEVPFFARYLEGQELRKIAAGQTLKYPSDIDEEVSYVTNKYPSDDDETAV
jgi:hypothetical protein